MKQLNVLLAEKKESILTYQERISDMQSEIGRLRDYRTHNEVRWCTLISNHYNIHSTYKLLLVAQWTCNLKVMSLASLELGIGLFSTLKSV